MENNELIQAMSDAQLEAIAAGNPNNPSIAALIAGILASRVKEIEATRIEAEFAAKMDKLASKGLPSPAEWLASGRQKSIVFVLREVEDGDLEMVEVKQADGSLAVETRQPMKQAWAYVPNAFWSQDKPKGSGTTSTTSSKVTKRTVSIVHKEGNVLVPVGTYPSGKAFVVEYNATNGNGDHIDVVAEGGGNSFRAMARHGYLAVDDAGNILAK